MPALVERQELSDAMKEALRCHIIKEREKKKREEKEAEKDFERRAKIEEERKRKEEEDSVTLEQIKEQLTALRKKLDTLKDEKHQQFCQLKKVLQEEEKRKQKEKEQKELGELHANHFSHSMQSIIMPGPGGHYQPHHQMQYFTGHSPGLVSQSSPHHHSLRHSITHAHQAPPVAHPGVKRPHSPGSPQPSPIQLYRQGIFTGPKYEHSFSNHPSHLGISNIASSTAQPNLLAPHSRHISVLHNAASPVHPPGSKSPYSLGKPHDIVTQRTNFADDAAGSQTSSRGRPNIRMLPQQTSLISQQISASPRSRPGSPSRYQSVHPDKPHSPFHGSSPLPGGRLFK